MQTMYNARISAKHNKIKKIMQNEQDLLNCFKVTETAILQLQTDQLSGSAADSSLCRELNLTLPAHAFID